MTSTRFRRLATTTFFLVGLLAVAGAQARTNVDISFGVPGVVVAPAYGPVYAPPPPVYGPPPVYYEPRPVYRPPVYVQPPVQYLPPPPAFAPYYIESRPRYYDDRGRWRGEYRDRDHDGIPDRYDRHDDRRDYYRR